MAENEALAVETPLNESEQVAEAAALLEAELNGEYSDDEPEIETDAEAEATDEPGDEPEETERAAADSDDSEQPEGAETDESPDIDYDQMIPMPGGESPMKLGELKDIAVNAKRAEAEMIERENAVMRERDQLRELIAASGGEVPPEVQQQMKANMQKHLEREHQAMLQAIPEWKDHATFQAERAELVDLFTSYGFTEAEIGNISDHRPLKLARDLMRMLRKSTAKVEQIKTAKAKPKPKTQGSKRTAKQRRYDAARTGGMSQKLESINELLTG